MGFHPFESPTVTISVPSLQPRKPRGQSRRVASLFAGHGWRATAVIAVSLGVLGFCSACAVPSSDAGAAAAGSQVAVVNGPTPAAATPTDPTAPSTIPPVARNGSPARPSVSAGKGGLTPVAPVTYPDGVSVKVTGVRAATESGNGPGEFPGRAYAVVALSLENQSAQPIDVNQVVVTATYGSPALIASPVYDSSEAQDFAGTVNPGGSASATYMFAVPVAQRGKVVLTVDFDSTHAAAQFTGAAR